MRVGVLLGGSGHQDGSEIHEATLTLLGLEEAGAEPVCLSLDKPQNRVVNHLTGEETSERRGLMEEAARIARGKIKKLSEVDLGRLDGLAIPGGTGLAYNFCNFALKGAQMEVDDQVRQIIAAIHEAKKPLGAICISPVIVAKVLGSFKPTLTIGTDPETAKAVESMGARHKDCTPADCVVDEQSRLVTTPAYMLGKSIRDIAPGIRKLTQELVRLVRG